jgi:hypothetical protein
VASPNHLTRMKGLIDKENGNSLTRILERIMDRGQPGQLILISQPEGKKATLDLGRDEVKLIEFADLTGEAAMRAITEIPLWTFEFLEAGAGATQAKAPRILRPVVRTAAAKAPVTKAVADPAPEESVTLPETAPTIASSIESAAPLEAALFAEPIQFDPPACHKLHWDAGTFTPQTNEAESEFIQGDFGYLYHQARAIGRCVGLSTLRAFAYAEDRGVRAASYRPIRGASFRCVVADEPANALQLLASL